MPLSNAAGAATIDVYRATADHAGAIRREEHGEICDILWHNNFAERHFA